MVFLQFSGNKTHDCAKNNPIFENKDLLYAKLYGA